MSKRKPNPIVDPNSYEPLGDYIILEPEQEAEVSEGGIHIPEQARSYLNEGKVVKTGPDVSPNISKGKFVTFEASSEFRLKMAKDLVLFVVKESSLILIREDKVSKLFPAHGGAPDFQKACGHSQVTTLIARGKGQCDLCGITLGWDNSTLVWVPLQPNT